jgi:thiamine biosynthesis protein ThiS
MKITLNQQCIEIKTADNTLYEILRQSQLPLSRIAVRVNKVVVPKARWQTTIINENDNLDTITLVSGG